MRCIFFMTLLEPCLALNPKCFQLCLIISKITMPLNEKSKDTSNVSMKSNILKTAFLIHFLQPLLFYVLKIHIPLQLKI